MVLITGVIKNPDGTPYVGSVKFALNDLGIESNTVYLPTVVTVDSDGTFTVDLWPNTNSLTSTYYKCSFDNGSVLNVSIPSNNPSYNLEDVILIDLSTLDPGILQRLDSIENSVGFGIATRVGDLEHYTGISDNRIPDIAISGEYPNMVAGKVSKILTIGDGLTGGSYCGDADVTVAIDGTVIRTTDGRLSDAREWVAPTAPLAVVSQPSNTTRYAWTPQRIWGTILSWFSTITSDDISEGSSNLYYTDSRVNNNLTVQANTTKVSATESVTTHKDITSAGSGQIITTPERTKLNNIEDNAQVNTVDSVAGKTGIIILNSIDIGLGNVPNINATNASNITSGTLDGSRLSYGKIANTPAQGNDSRFFNPREWVAPTAPLEVVSQPTNTTRYAWTPQRIWDTIVSWFSTITSDDISEGSNNLYYTDNRVANNPDVQANTNKVSATGPVTTHSDITSAGSGQIITTSERTKLSNIEENAQPNTVISVSGKIGDVVLDSNDVGLGNVLNIDTSNADNITLGTLNGSRLSYGTSANTPAQGNDSRFFNAREWVAPTAPLTVVSQPSNTTRYAWTPQRIWDTILAWFSNINSDDIPEGSSNLYYTDNRVANNPDVQTNTTKVSATESVTTHKDITSAGSGQIITTSERTKLNNIEENAQVNTVNSVAGKTGDVVLDSSNVGLENVLNIDTTNADNITSGTLSGSRLSYGTVANTPAQGNDARFTDSREWTASTVSQSVAQSGTDTTRYAWTSQRVRDNVSFYTQPYTSAEKSKLAGLNSADYLPVGGTAVNAHLLDNIDSSQFLRSDTNDTMTGSLTVSGVILANEIRDRTGSQLVLNAGESEGKVANQTGELIYLNAEGGISVNTPSIPNWNTGYGVHTAIITGNSINLSGNVVWHGGNLIPSVAASNNTIVQRNSSGYVFVNYINTTPNTVSSGVTQVCVETGNDGFIRHGTPGAILGFIGATPSSTPNTPVMRNGSGDINARLFRSEFDTTNSNIGFIMTQVDTSNNNYLRPSTPAQFRSAVTDAYYLGITSRATDSDRLDGLHAGSFIRSDIDTVLYNARVSFAHDQPASSSITGSLHGGLELRSSGSSSTAGAAFMAFRRPGAYAIHFGLDRDNQLKVGGWSLGNQSHKIWHAGNDGSGSGLDADLWDGWQRNTYLNQSVRSDSSPTFGNLTVTGVIYANEIRDRTGTQLVLNCGESEGKVSGQTGELVYINAEGGLSVNTPTVNNWGSGYAVNTAIITGNSIVLSGQPVWHSGNLPVATGATANHIVKRTASGHIYGNYGMFQHVNIASSNDVTTSITKFYVETNNDHYIRQATVTTVKNILGRVNDSSALGGVTADKFVRADISDTLYGTLYQANNNIPALVCRNSSYTGNELQIGGWSSSNSNNISRIRNSNQNLHIDSAANGGLYINWYTNGSIYTSSPLRFYNKTRTVQLGDIGSDNDNTWFRINQLTNKNIYTPRMFRADGGIQVDGKWVVSNTGGTLYEGGTALSSKYLRKDISGTSAGRIVFTNSQSSNINTNSGNQGGLELKASGTGSTAKAAFMSFHRPGAYAVYFGLGTSNQLEVGGWSMGNQSYKIWHAGNDGSGSGLDADLWDGWQRNTYLNQSVTTSSTPTFNGISFGSTTKQHINLWSTQYGLGVQSSTTYWRSGSNFALFMGGVHSNTALDAGSGGKRIFDYQGTVNQFNFNSYVNFNANGLKITGTSPTIHLEDTDHRSFWLHNNSNIFYILSDRDNDRSWETPYPASWNDISQKSYFWGKEVAVHNTTPKFSGIDIYKGTTKMGDIGVLDTTWLRINQATNKNIYTPRMIRADGGFQVDAKQVVSADGNTLYENNVPLATKYIRKDIEDTINVHTRWSDSKEIRLGAQADGRLFHNGVDLYMRNYTGSNFYQNFRHGGVHYFQSEDISGVNRALCYMSPDDLGVRLFHKGAERLRTTANGIDVYGNGHLKCTFVSGDYMRLENSSNAFIDLANRGGVRTARLIVSDGSTSNYDGQLKIESGSINLYSAGSGGNSIVYFQGNSATKKFGLNTYANNFLYIQQFAEANQSFEGNIIRFSTTEVRHYVPLVNGSSRHIKDIKGGIPDGLDLVNRLNPVVYNYKGQKNTEVGLIAEEVPPESHLVYGSGHNMAIDYTKLPVYMIDAIKQLTKRIEALEENAKKNNR